MTGDNSISIWYLALMIKAKSVFCRVIGFGIFLCHVNMSYAQRDFALSTGSVLSSKSRLSEIIPKLNLASQIQAKSLLNPAGPLGLLGPLGAYGPLGLLGPIGNNSWNPAVMMDRVGDWSEYSKYQTKNGGPLSASGPLGHQGPLSEPAIRLLNAQLGHLSHLGAGGLLTALGPFGPLGPVGPLGPLGPMGAHGFSRNQNGEYLLNGKVQRKINVDYDGVSSRSFDLVESYSEDFAKKMTDNHGSFLVSGRIDLQSGKYEKDVFSFVASENQLITLVVTPEYSLDQFAAKVTSADGHANYTSHVFSHVNFIQFSGRQGQRYTVEITLLHSNHFLSKNYRLSVISIAEGLALTPFEGPHMLRSPKKVCQSVL
ncbi:MAG: hypothetical protein ACK5P5_12485 [Pseudobdellovibrionaceae bacterium]